MIGSLIAGIAGSNNGGGGDGGQGAMNAADHWSKVVREQAMPWINPGIRANDQLLRLSGLGHLTSGEGGVATVDETNWLKDQNDALARFQTSPGYQFRVGEGIKALDRSAAAKGALFSGAQGKALNDYGQNMGSQEFGNYVNMLGGLSGSGLSANTSAGNNGTNIMGSGVSALNQGNALRASAYQNSANALASGISSGVNNIFAAAPYIMAAL